MTIFVFWQELMAIRHISDDKPFNYKENTFEFVCILRCVFKAKNYNRWKQRSFTILFKVVGNVVCGGERAGFYWVS